MRVCLSHPTGPLGTGCAAVCPLFMINFPVVPSPDSHPGPFSRWASPQWGREPGWQLAGTLFSGTVGLEVGWGWAGTKL